MPHSMTAFARNQIQESWGTLICEIRSVNHRYLELQFRMPSSLRDCESQMRDIFRAELKRGKIECNFQLLTEAAELEDLKINNAVLEQVIVAAERVSTQLKNPEKTSALELLRWPGVLDQNNLDETIIQQAALKLLQTTLSEFMAARDREGQELTRFIEKRLAVITEQAKLVSALMPDLLTAQRQRIQQKFAELQLQLDPERLEQEMVLYVYRSDVNEELDRLSAHITEFTRALKTKDAVGRRLDFLTQELNREANTLSSKSIDTRMTQAAVEMKVAIEQIREQIQNIE